MKTDPLALDPETMRRLGYQTVDRLVEWLATAEDRPALTRATRREMEQRLQEPAPATGQPLATLLHRLDRDVLAFMARNDHPRYFGYIPGCGTWPAALGDFIASACNIDAGSWLLAAGPSEVELVVLDWFKSWIGYPTEAAGVLVSGGSAANLTALACARETLIGPMSERVVVYVADQTHSSLARGARVLGFRPDQLRVLPVDRQYRMRLDALVAAMDADVAAGRRPLCVVANAGATNTGAIDPLPELARLCQDRGVWLHVDGAYGAFAALTERGKTWLQGIELADSVTLDPHKWLYQPFECGCVLVRDGRHLRAAFQIRPDYLQDIDAAEQEVNFADLGLQLSRASHALKLWLSLQAFGVDAFRAAIDRSLDLARWAQERITASPDLDLLHPATLGVVCFRRRFAGVEEEEMVARLNSQVLDGLIESGQAVVSSTRLHGRYALRLCVLNHTSRVRDLEHVLRWIETAPVPPQIPVAPVVSDRHLDIHLPWLERSSARVADLRGLALFADARTGDLDAVVQAAYEHVAQSGEVIVQQWSTSREFYVILEGTAAVHAGERLVANLGAGDFFGELAALDWGAGYGYPRLATVTATAPLRLLVLPQARFQALLRQAPRFEQQIRQAVRERLPTLASERAGGADLQEASPR